MKVFKTLLKTEIMIMFMLKLMLKREVIAISLENIKDLYIEIIN